MNRIYLIIIFTMFALSCKQNKQISSDITEKESKVTYLAFNLTALKETKTEFNIVNIEIDTLLLPNSPLPFSNDSNDKFRIHIVDQTNNILFGSEDEVDFRENEEGNEVGYIKFYCTVPEEASMAVISYYMEDNLWKQIKTIDL